MMLKLPKLPDRAPVKVTISVSPELHQTLTEYAGAYEVSYGQAEPLAELIPAMLASFLESDREFSRRRKSRSRE
jgi:hypothetical protein